eukprot:12463140-Alexandrium_andersonii.AAC.1
MCGGSTPAAFQTRVFPRFTRTPAWCSNALVRISKTAPTRSGAQRTYTSSRKAKSSSPSCNCAFASTSAEC